MAGKIKKALLSALVLPGLGQLMARQYVKGAVFAVIALGSIVILAQEISTVLQEALLKLQASSQAPDMASIMSITKQVLDSHDTQLATLATYAFIICWALAILDALFIKSPQDSLKDASSDSKEVSSTNAQTNNEPKAD